MMKTFVKFKTNLKRREYSFAHCTESQVCLKNLLLLSVNMIAVCITPTKSRTQRNLEGNKTSQQKDASLSTLN